MTLSPKFISSNIFEGVTIQQWVFCFLELIEVIRYFYNRFVISSSTNDTKAIARFRADPEKLLYKNIDSSAEL